MSLTPNSPGKDETELAAAAAQKPSSLPPFRALAVVYVTVFVDLLGFGIIIPIMPYLALSLGASGLAVGALMTAYSAAQFIGAPICGRLSDRFGRRPILVLALAGSTAAFILMGAATSLAVLFASRLLAGLFGGSISAAQAYIADVTTPAERSKYMGILGASIGMGFVFGPALGALLADSGYGMAAYAAAAIAGINCIAAMLLLPESRKHGVRVHAGVGALLKAMGRPKLNRLLVASFLATAALVAMESTYALLGAAAFGLNARGMGFVFTFVGVVMVLVQGGLIGRIVPRFGERAVALTGALILAISLLALPYMPELAASVAALAFVAAGQALVSPTLSTLLSKAAGRDEQGGVLGLGQSANAAARALGPLCAGALYDVARPAPYIAAAAMALAAGLLLRRVQGEDAVSSVAAA